MFDHLIAERPEVASLSATELVDAVDEWARVVNAAAAMRASLVAELFTRRTGCETAQDRVEWWADPETAVVAELAAALRVTQGLAARETERAVALRDRLPAVAALFAEGLISEMTVRTIVFRTALINDPEVLMAVDAALAQQVRYFGALSAKKVEQAIDATVIAHDRVAQRRARERAAERTVGFGDPDDVPGMTSMWARLDTVDAVALKDRVDSVAATVCASDPRGIDERRAAALGVIGAGLDVLACACGHDDCDAAAAERPVRTTTVFVIVDANTAEDATAQSVALADTRGNSVQRENRGSREDAVDGAKRDAVAGRRTVIAEVRPRPAAVGAPAGAEGPTGNPAPAEESAPANEPARADQPEPAGSQGGESAAPPADLANAPVPTTEPVAAPASVSSDPAKRAAPTARGFGVMPGAGVVPTALLGAVLDGARLRRVVHPGDSGPEDRYTPSAALAAFVRCRDMTCRFPFCDAPATDADIDHTVPWPLGPTHASNTKCLCRVHHLVKTFWGGPDGWRDRQLPDGTVIWTSPTGHTYTTYPGGRLWFPSLCRPTATLWHGDPPELLPLPDDRRAAGMPRRRRPRTLDRARRVLAERRLNAADIAAEPDAQALADGNVVDIEGWIHDGGPPSPDVPPF